MSADRIEVLSRSLADSTSRRSLLTMLGVGAAGAAVTVAGLNEALAKTKKGNVHATRVNQLTNLPVRGKGRKGTFKGRLDITEFRLNQAGTGIEAVGLLTGKATGDAKKTGNDAKKSRNVRNKEVVLPVTVTSGGTTDVQSQVVCEILNLVLGPIDLNILGLRLQTNTIRIRLTADSQGGLLGSLLCGLLGPIDLGNLGALVGLLNQILGILGGL
jgi:hypothetical protein